MNLLIADDELIIREGLKSLDWSTIGISSVFSASNGLEAKEYLDEYDIDIAILDIRMPGMTGIELARYVFEYEKDTIVVFLTGYAEFDYAKKAISYGVSEYIVKPFRPREITSVIKTIIDKKQKNAAQSTTNELSVQIREYFSSIEETSRRIIEEMTQHYQDDLSLDEYAERYHFTHSYLSRKIRQDTGFSFMEIVKAIRLSYAIEKICSGMKISDACYQAGFQDQRYFSQVFKSVFDYSPSELKSRDGHVSFSDVISYINEKNRQKKRDNQN